MLNTKCLLILSVLIWFLENTLCQKDESKSRRILLNDPNILQQELSSLKALLQETTAKVSKQESTILQLQSNISAQERTILQLQNNTSAQEVKLISQQSTITDFQNKLDREVLKGGGAVYTRWGRKHCPDNETELVYSGITGGSLYTQTGAAAEYVCLPLDPIWMKYDDSVSNYLGTMYGAEYQENFYKSGLYNNDVPCAVCRRKSASNVLMIPGRNQCYGDWKVEYYGYLSSGAPGHVAASQFVCLDVDPEVVFHSGRDDNGKLFYMVEGICGSLSCPPYVNGRELTCAVCTK